MQNNETRIELATWLIKNQQDDTLSGAPHWLQTLDFTNIFNWTWFTCLNFILISDSTLHKSLHTIGAAKALKLTPSIVRALVYQRLLKLLLPEIKLQSLFRFAISMPRENYHKFDMFQNAETINYFTQSLRASNPESVPFMLAGGPPAALNKRLHTIQEIAGVSTRF